MTPTFVLIHGSNANSFTWAPLQRELALLGHRSLAVDLPGHGFEAGVPSSYQTQDAAELAEAPSNLDGVGLQANIDHMVAILRRAKEHGPVIAVAHSRGGLTLTAVANRHPELIDRLVYVSAWCCVEHGPREYMHLPEAAACVLDQVAGVAAANPARLGAVRMNWRTADPVLLAALKESMLADGSDDEFRVFLSTLTPDESLDAGGPDDLVNAETWGRLPRSYIRVTQDTSIPVELQDLFIKEADALTPDNTFDVHTIETSHVGFLVRPERAAAILAGMA
ncbi:alpha/beta hydrolase [Glycomyces luteolus]|uniref:Alpha/beta hydrolase n=1 Tax=Glycomyces luteolus TaxID=2670330 RepID=A0A9X3SRA1_9ACTN|nr:alpha/beta hydrolase [Glycomyces luteolus]MDA1358318.1 alpha/beta hydrolase [Glycomyces luteolus]